MGYRPTIKMNKFYIFLVMISFVSCGSF